MIGAPVGRDDHVRGKAGCEGLYQNMHAGTLARAAGGIADDPAHRIPRRYRHQLLAGLKRDIHDAFGRGIKTVERALGPGLDLDRIDVPTTNPQTVEEGRKWM